MENGRKIPSGELMQELLCLHRGRQFRRFVALIFISGILILIYGLSDMMFKLQGEYSVLDIILNAAYAAVGFIVPLVFGISFSRVARSTHSEDAFRSSINRLCNTMGSTFSVLLIAALAADIGIVIRLMLTGAVSGIGYFSVPVLSLFAVFILFRIFYKAWYGSFSSFGDTLNGVGPKCSLRRLFSLRLIIVIIESVAAIVLAFSYLPQLISTVANAEKNAGTLQTVFSSFYLIFFYLIDLLSVISFTEYFRPAEALANMYASAVISEKRQSPEGSFAYAMAERKAVHHAEGYEFARSADAPDETEAEAAAAVISSGVDEGSEE